MDTKTKTRGVSLATLIPLFLIALGIFVWGLQYKLSLYSASGSSSRSIPQAKLLSPYERPGSVQTTEQLSPTLLPWPPLRFQFFLIAAVFAGVLFIQLVRAGALNPRDARQASNSICAFFFFRPPPTFARER